MCQQFLKLESVHLTTHVVKSEQLPMHLPHPVSHAAIYNGCARGDGLLMPAAAGEARGHHWHICALLRHHPHHENQAW
jgi:hypothetical protein